jgi:TonB family protein
MSHELLLGFFNKSKPSSMEEKFEVESDQRLYSCLGSGSLLGLGLMSYMLTLQVYIPRKLKIDPPCIDCGWDLAGPDFTVKIPTDLKRHKQPKLVKHRNLETVQQTSAPTAKHPAKVTGTMLQKLISSKSNRSDFSAYEVIGQVMQSLDLDKLSQVASLSRTDPTRLSGRKGRQSEAFNPGYYEMGTGNNPSKDFALPRLNLDALPPRIKPGPENGTLTTIDAVMGETTRSSASILAVIRAHAPGLRYIYNNFLRIHSGLQGKVTLRFAIAPSGQVVDVALAASSTKLEAFDDAVLQQVMSWRFDPVKGIGNDLVTVPFNFSE